MLLLALTLLVATVSANVRGFSKGTPAVCSGMYSKADWSGAVDPYVLLTLKKAGKLPSVSVAIFEYSDFDFLGALLEEDVDGVKVNRTHYLCDQFAVDHNLCKETLLNRYIIDVAAAANHTHNKMVTAHLTSLGEMNISYPVMHTGYYCVVTHLTDDYSGSIEFRNAYGHLAGAEVPKLPLYGMMTILYALGMAAYGWQFYLHRHELLPLQKYMLFFFGFLTAETILVWSFYDLKNNVGDKAGVYVYMAFVSTLNAVKFAFSLFLLAVICHGYGVVYPKLEKPVMLKCKLVGAANFVAGVLHFIPGYISNPEVKLGMSFGLRLPLMISFMTWYFITLTLLRNTTLHLREQGQIVKLKMYRTLFNVLFALLLVMFFGAFLTIFVFFGMLLRELVDEHWKSRFFVFDFWPSVVFFATFLAVAYIWRPSDTAYMLAVSSQLPGQEGVADFDLEDLELMSDEEDATRRSDLFELDVEEDGDAPANRPAVPPKGKPQPPVPPKSPLALRSALPPPTNPFKVDDE